MNARPNIHRSHRDPDFTVVPPFVSKGKELNKLVDYYSKYAHNTNFFSNLALTSHTRSAAPISRPPCNEPKIAGGKTQLMKQYVERDTFCHIYGAAGPSNLIEPATVNDKYDCTIREGNELYQAASSLKAPTFFYEAIKDPVKDDTRPQEKPFIREMIVRHEYDHEYSLHNQLTQSIRGQSSLERALVSDENKGLPFYCSKKKLLEGIKDVVY